jgi:hypothetical protein
MPPFRRIAVTVPPAQWFHGISHAIYRHYRDALRGLGIELYEVPIHALLAPYPGQLEELVSELRSFRPELAFGLPLGSYALISRAGADETGRRPNIFTDILDIPTVCLWDHAPLELAEQLLTPHPATPAASRTGTLAPLREALAHPRLIHWSRDSGQSALMRKLGFLPPAEPLFHISPALRGIPEDPGDLPRPATDVSFVGHVSQAPASHPHPALATLARESIDAWLAEGGALWDILSARIAALSPAVRQELALDSDQSFFWAWVHRVIVHEAQARRRLQLLGGARAPIACYGNLRGDWPGVPPNLIPVPGHIPFGPRLLGALTRHAIAVDVSNPGFINGFGHKPMQGFAAGAFMLIERKQDFVDAFGEAGEAVSYRDGADLAAKIDLYLGKPALRRELTGEMRQRIAERHTLEHVLTRVLDAAASYRTSRSTRLGSPPVVRENLLRQVRWLPTKPYVGVRVKQTRAGVRISCKGKDWRYAATIELGDRTCTLVRPFLELTLAVEHGRLGVGLMQAAGPPTQEQHVRTRDRAVVVHVDLPREGRPVVLLRKTSDEPVSVTVIDAVLCDRPG